MKHCRLFFYSLFICVALSCTSDNSEPESSIDQFNPGTGTGNEGTGEGPETGFDLTGTLTFQQAPRFGGMTSVVEFDLPNGSLLKRLGDGMYGWRHPDGDLIYVKTCGDWSNTRWLLMNENSIEVPITPCTGELGYPSYATPRLEFGRLSPDKNRIASEWESAVGFETKYDVVVVENNEIITIFENFFGPEWLPDGRLLLAGTDGGIYVTDIDSSPQQINQDGISSPANNLDVDPSGTTIAFEWNQRIWTMNIDGSNLKELVSGNRIYINPAWSPDGKYIAFLGTSGNEAFDYDPGIYIINFVTEELEFLDLSPVADTDFQAPKGPLSWTE